MRKSQVFESLCLHERDTSTIQKLRVLKMAYNIQNYWISGLCPSSGILNANKDNVSETGSVSVHTTPGDEQGAKTQEFTVINGPLSNYCDNRLERHLGYSG
jgi:hypothetical protein